MHQLCDNSSTAVDGAGLVSHARAVRPTHAGVYHVTARSIAEERIFRVTADFVEFVTLLGAAARAFTCHAFCVMPTHYHVLGTYPDGGPRPTTYRLNRSYAIAFNRRHARRGHVFDSPYASVPVLRDEHLKWLVPYIAQNPPAPQAWQWSSFVRSYSFVDDRLLVEAFRGRDAMLDYAFSRAAA